MENGGFWAPLIILILAVAGMFGFRYLEQLDAATAALVDTKLVLKQTQESLAGRKEMWAIVDAAAQKLAKARLVQDEADKKQRLVEGDLRYTVKSFKAAVDKVRTDALGCEIPEIALLNGTFFKAAKIRKMDNTSMTFLHSNGISTVQIDQLPQDLVEKFDMGARSLVNQLDQLEASMDSSDSPVEAKPEIVENPKLLAVQKRIAHLEIQINSATIHKEKLEKEVIDCDAQIKSIEATGGAATFSMRTRRDIAEGNAGTARRELNLLKMELEKLKISESALTSKQ